MPNPPKFIALLRGINVGKAKRIAMADLRALLTELGYSGIVTLLNSGNVVFQASGGTPARHAADISAAIAKRLGLEVPVVVKTAEELSTIVAENSLAEKAIDPSRLLVVFSQDNAALAGLDAVSSLVAEPEAFLSGKQAVYLYCATGILESKAAGALLGKSGKALTTRNWATVLKLQALAKAAET